VRLVPATGEDEAESVRVHPRGRRGRGEWREGNETQLDLSSFITVRQGVFLQNTQDTDGSCSHAVHALRGGLYQTDTDDYSLRLSLSVVRATVQRPEIIVVGYSQS
jgi:hypothetical protein